MRRLRVDDEVIVLSGKDRGSTGAIVQFVGDDRVVVGNVNMVRKHLRATQPGARQGIFSQEAAMHISNVAIFNPNTEKPDKVGFREEKGAKVRFYRSTGERIDP